MHILVTGGAGYIGSHVVLELLDNGYDVTIIDNLSLGQEINIDSRATFYLGTILSEKDLDNIFSKKFDAVIHLAAYKSVSDSMKNPSKYLYNNMIGTSKLLIACNKYNINNFIFSSTAAVYGEPKYLPIDELHPTNPKNYYGELKLQIEKNLNWYSKLSKMNYVALRYFNVAGYDNKARIKGKEINPQNLIPIIMDVLLGNIKKLEVFGDNYDTHDGTPIRDYIHVSDLAQAHVLSLKYLNNHKKNLTLNLGTEKGYSVFDIIKQCELIANKKVNYSIAPRRRGDAEKIVSNFNKAKTILNWNPKESNLKTIIKTCWNVYKGSNDS